jgi:hypothetical protein
MNLTNYIFLCQTPNHRMLNLTNVLNMKRWRNMVNIFRYMNVFLVVMYEDFQAYCVCMMFRRKINMVWFCYVILLVNRCRYNVA